MKREVAFFKDRRAGSGAALLDTMRALGMSDTEIKSALLEARKEIANHEGARQLDDKHGTQPGRYWPDAEIDAATDEVIRRGEDEELRRGG
jgi:hypothetical protein